MLLIINETARTPALYFSDDGQGCPPQSQHWQRLLGIPVMDTALRITGNTAAPSGRAVLDNADGALTALFSRDLMGAAVSVHDRGRTFTGTIRSIQIAETITLDVAA